MYECPHLRNPGLILLHGYGTSKRSMWMHVLNINNLASWNLIFIMDVRDE